MKFIASFISLLVLILTVGYSQAGNMASETPEEFIHRLYKDYLPDLQQDKYWFDNEKKLSQYFDPTLTKLLLRDKECKEKTHEICTIDFAPIIDAQDFDEKYPVSLEVKRMDSTEPVRVKVIFSNMSQRILIYELKKTKKGWRISDIVYSEGGSLKKMLSQKQ